MTRREKAVYAVLLAVCFLVAVTAGWTALGAQFDNDVYDFLFRIHPLARGEPASVVLGIDERTLREMGGQPAVRRILTEGLLRLAEAGPSVVVVDLILADKVDPAGDTALAEAFARVKTVVQASALADGVWEQPLDSFRRTAAAIGHVHSDPDALDNVVRRIPLEKAAGRERYWAAALEAFRLTHPQWTLTESPDAIELGPHRMQAPREESRPLRILFREPGAIPEVTFHELAGNPAAAAKLTGKAVFIGITAQSAAPDRHMTPSSYGQSMPGVEIHANAYETLTQGIFLQDAANLTVVLFCAALALASGLIFHLRSGASAYILGGALLASVHIAPYAAFRAHIVFPYAAPLGAAWLSSIAAASFQHFIVRRRLRKSEFEREGYQKAIHFVAHEMRTPLTAIQGSSELMGRYKLSEEKRGEIARMINSESKRLARLIQTFLDVERLTAGHMDLKREPFDAAELVRVCVERARPIAEPKRIQLHLEDMPGATLIGDRELMEYAVYNLLTNAVKYSGSGTQVTVSGRLEGDQLRLAVRDQGIGMDEKELGNIFKKFYRTSKAETSGEAGTGIGLSIVEQIVAQHSGKMEVASKPGVGSCFTMILPAAAPVTRKSD